MRWEQRQELEQLARLLQSVYDYRSDWPAQEEVIILVELSGGASVQITAPQAGALPDFRTGDLRGIRIAHAIRGFSEN